MTDARPDEDDESQTAPQPVWAKPPTTNDAFSPQEDRPGRDHGAGGEPEAAPAWGAPPFDASPGEPQPEDHRATDERPGYVPSADAQPSDAQSADVQPSDAHPADAHPADAHPADAHPADAHRAYGQPADAHRAYGQTGDVQPADAQRAYGQTGDAQSADAQPSFEQAGDSRAGTQPFASWQAGDQSAGDSQTGGSPADDASAGAAPQYAPPSQFIQPPAEQRLSQPPPPAPTWARPPEPAQGGFSSPGWGFADPSGRPPAPEQPGDTPAPAYPTPTQPTPAYATPGPNENPAPGPVSGESLSSGVPGSGQGPDAGDPSLSLDHPASGDHYAWGGTPPSPGPGTARTRRGGAFLALLVAGSLVAGALGGIAGAALLDDLNDSSGRNPTISLPEPAKDTTPAGAVTKVADAVLPSVVSIRVRSSTEEGTGSGFVIDAGNGYILTNNHVVTAGGSKPATDIEVVFQDGTQVAGKVVGLDASYDLAVVKVAAKGLRTLQLGDSDAVRVGDPVIAIGAPLGLQGTVTTGIVSALNRPVAAGDSNTPAFINAIQTDAAINPGNSGGPLVDSTGKVIGINSAIARSPGSTSDTGGNIGLGFSIPSNQARRTAQELIRTGKAQHPIIGVTLDNDYTGEGVKVSERPVNGNPAVTAGGPASKAGIQPGDVITKFNGRPMTEPDELIVAIRARTPGETITLTVRRTGSERQVRVKLSAASG